MNPHRQPRRHGFTLVEIMIALPLMAAFAAVSVPLLRWSIRSMAASGADATASARLDAAVSELRRDVWNSTTCDTPSPGELRITGPDLGTVTWRVGGSGLTRHGAGHADVQWPRLFPSATFAFDGAAVRLQVGDAPGFRGGTVTLRGGWRPATGGPR